MHYAHYLDVYKDKRFTEASKPTYPHPETWIKK